LGYSLHQPHSNSPEGAFLMTWHRTNVVSGTFALVDTRTFCSASSGNGKKIEISPDGLFLYVCLYRTNPKSHAWYSFAVDGAGTLTEVHSPVATLTPNYSYEPKLALSPDGKHAYAF
jgi:hypothetical protein